MTVCTHWMISHGAHFCAPPLDSNHMHSLTEKELPSSPREDSQSLTCLALSAVKEEPHLPHGQFSSEGPFGYSSGRHRPASSAPAHTVVPIPCCSFTTLRHPVRLDIPNYWTASRTDMLYWVGMHCHWPLCSTPCQSLRSSAALGISKAVHTSFWPVTWTDMLYRGSQGAAGLRWRM